MTRVIDVHDLPVEDVIIIENLVRLLRNKTNPAMTQKVDKEPNFSAWPLGAKGKLTRKRFMNTSNETALIDTNVLIYAADETSPFHQSAKDLRDR